MPSESRVAPLASGPELSPAAEALLLEALAAGTSRAYQGSWSQWAQYCEKSGVDPYITARTPESWAQGEAAVLEFMTHLSVNMRRAPSTIRQKLFAISFVHTAAGLDRDDHSDV